MKKKVLGALRRIVILFLVIWTVVSLVTILIQLVPGDPAVAILGDQATPEQIAQFREKHGLDRPSFFFSIVSGQDGNYLFRWNGWNNRYTEYWRGILHGDLGKSFRTDRPVLD
jgi:ABC-type dipeptide/oligopeptide/nickel transport system permease component